MGFILFDILYIFFELYTGIIVLYVIVQLLRKKKLPWILLLIESGCLIVFFYLRYLVNQHELIVIGGYQEDPKDYGQGIANVSVYYYNLAFIIGLFLITQLFFWAFFTEKYESLNKRTPEENTGTGNILNQEKLK